MKKIKCKVNKVKRKKKKKMEDFTLSMIIPAAHAPEFVKLLCIGGNYKEFIPDPDSPGEMKENTITEPEFAQTQHDKIIRDWVRGQRHRRKADLARIAAEKANAEAVEEPFDDYLKD